MTLQLKVVVFILVSLGLAWLSRRSLRSFRFHGFYRFFTWEAFLALVLLNFDYWFYEPFSIRQIGSWVLLTICIVMVIYGAQSLHKVGKPTSQRDDTSLIGIEKTSELVTAGAYRYVRHPIYSSVVYGAWGVFLKQPTVASGCLTVIVILFVTMTAKIEESENIRFFGAVYERYMKQTKMFIPFVF